MLLINALANGLMLLIVLALIFGLFLFIGVIASLIIIRVIGALSKALRSFFSLDSGFIILPSNI